jgi:hypothetical protein
MPSRVVGLPRAQAIQLAEYERDSLVLRADGSKCPELWRDAAHHADLVVQCLRAGKDTDAARHAGHITSRWKKAADCEGWPTPANNYVATGAAGSAEEKLDLILKNQAEQAKKRRLALTLGAVGALLAAARLGIVAIPLVKAAKRRPRRK